MRSPLRLGTRSSALALTQSGLVADALRALGWEVDLVPVRTDGDRLRGSLAQIGGTGVFVAALRDALLNGVVDIAVHSLKDLPTSPTAGIALAAVPEREDPRDVMCARSGWTLADLPLGSRVGTGSPRRAAQLRHARADLTIVDIRGNVDTRLRRVRAPDVRPGSGVDAGPLDAVVLARAGLARLGRLDAVTETLGTDVMLPAPGQGALAVECRAEDMVRLGGPDGLGHLEHTPTRLAVIAERALLARLEAGCSAPVGALAGLDLDGYLRLDAVAFAADGRPERVSGHAAQAAGRTGQAADHAERPAVHAERRDVPAAVARDQAVALGERLAEDLLARDVGGDALRPRAPSPATTSPPRSPDA